MPKRIGFIFEKVISPENCAAAVRDMAKAKFKVRQAQKMAENAESLGLRISQELADGNWKPAPYRTKTIKDGYYAKERHIKVPCLYDQCIHHALMRVTAPYILRRNYFYNCGSIPKAGQSRACRAVRRWMAKKKILRYGATLDVHHFFETCGTEAVMTVLSRIFKDKRFLELHRKVMESMDGTLAIGFNVSHWYANLVLGYVDRQIKQRLLQKNDQFARYMDDMVMLSNNKRKLHKAVRGVAECLAELGLRLKSNWQVYRIKGRGVTFLSYRFFHGYTILRKRLAIRISRRIKQLVKNGKKRTLRDAQSMMSYKGILMQCNSHHFKERWIYPLIDFKQLRRYIRRESRVYKPAACL